jgi:hypothetical protein
MRHARGNISHKKFPIDDISDLCSTRRDHDLVDLLDLRQRIKGGGDAVLRWGR